MKSLDQLDRWIAGKVRELTAKVTGPAPGRELLEIRREILENVRDKIEPMGGGKCLLPFNVISIRIAAEDATQLELRRAAFDSETVEQDIRDLLKEAGCPAPSGLRVEIAVEDDPAAAWSHPVHIDYASQKASAAPRSTPSSRPAAKLTVVLGEADPTELPVTAERVNIGRTKEVMGERYGLRRRNDLAFADSETSVSREHAYIRWDAESGRYRLYDSGSQRGTSVFREGRRLEVPKGAPRGLQLQPGDEIHLGEARVRFDSEA